MNVLELVLSNTDVLDLRMQRPTRYSHLNFVIRWPQQKHGSNHDTDHCAVCYLRPPQHAPLVFWRSGCHTDTTTVCQCEQQPCRCARDAHQQNYIHTRTTTNSSPCMSTPKMRVLGTPKFKGVRNIPGIKTAKKRVLITKIKNEKGECITSRKGIADVFGEFYKRLYEDNERGDFEHEMSDDRRILEITTEEPQSAISKLKKKANPQTAMEFVPKTSKLATTRREK